MQAQSRTDRSIAVPRIFNTSWLWGVVLTLFLGYIVYLSTEEERFLTLRQIVWLLVLFIVLLALQMRVWNRSERTRRVLFPDSEERERVEKRSRLRFYLALLLSPVLLFLGFGMYYILTGQAEKLPDVLRVLLAPFFIALIHTVAFFVDQRVAHERVETELTPEQLCAGERYRLRWRAISDRGRELTWLRIVLVGVRAKKNPHPERMGSDTFQWIYLVDGDASEDNCEMEFAIPDDTLPSMTSHKLQIAWFLSIQANFSHRSSIEQIRKVEVHPPAREGHLALPRREASVSP